MPNAKQHKKSRWDNNTASPQTGKIDREILPSPEPQRTMPNAKQHKKSRWDNNTSSPQTKAYQANRRSELSSAQNFLEPSEKLLGYRSKCDTSESNVNEMDPVDLLVQPLAILLKDFPKNKLTTSQMETIEESIVDKILLAESVKPQFYGSTYEAGYLAMHCCNNITLEWIKKIISSIKPWPSAHLFATEEAKIPYPKIAVGQFLTSEDLPTEVILDNIKYQNLHLNVDQWQVLDRKNSSTSAKLALSIDRISAAKLGESNNRISFRTVQVLLLFQDENSVFNAEKDFYEWS